MSNQLIPQLQTPSTRQQFISSLIEIETLFSYKKKVIPIVFMVIIYLQILKYPIDTYIGLWLGSVDNKVIIDTSSIQIFSYLSLSVFKTGIPSLVPIIFTIVYCTSFVILLVFQKLRMLLIASVIYQILRDMVSYVFFIFLIFELCKPIVQGMNQIKWESIVSLIMMVLFSLIILLQNYLNFQPIKQQNSQKIGRYSNWSTAFLLFYIIGNEITLAICQRPIDSVNLNNLIPHLIVMNILFLILVLIIMIKSEIMDEKISKLEKILACSNMLAILSVDIMASLNFWIDLALWGILLVLFFLCIWFYEGFNLKFELDNINKWSTSLQMISYSKKLNILLENKDDYYYKTLILGYNSIHNQKCDNEACPLKANSPPDILVEELIKKIYNDGCRLSPLSQDLLLDLSKFLFSINSKDKALKILLSIEKSELSLEKLYHFVKVRRRVYGEISEQPNQNFLDILSEMEVKDYQSQIIKKFEESALANLQFWSVLNEDYPDFNKLHQVGIQRVRIGEKVHELYEKICKIANSEKITQFYIHYLKDIENDEFMFDEIVEMNDEEKNLKDRIVIEDWANNSSPVIIVSTEEQNQGIIVDLNTTCATIFGYEKYELISRNVNHIFPDKLSSQISRFLECQEGINNNDTDKIFYGGCRNGYCIKFKRSIHFYNSIQTGCSVIITIQKEFSINNSYLLFTLHEEEDQRSLKKKQQNSQLISLSSSCIQYLGIDIRMVETKKKFNEFFLFNISDVGKEKLHTQLRNLLNFAAIQSILQKKIKDSKKKKWFSIEKETLNEFYAIKFIFSRNFSMPQFEKQIPQQANFSVSPFQFHLTDCFTNFTYTGSRKNQGQVPLLSTLFSMSLKDKEFENSNEDYASGISTLRLHENYIKVIQDGINSESEFDGHSSDASTAHQLINTSKQEKLAKKDEQKIFESHRSYCEFIQKNNPKSYVRITALIFCFLTIGTYIACNFLFQIDYSDSIENYDKIMNKYQIISQISIARFLVIEAKSVLKTQKIFFEPHILKTMLEVKDAMQKLLPQYTEPFPVNVTISADPFSSKELMSDQFALSYIGYLDEIYNQLKSSKSQNFQQSVTSLKAYPEQFILENGKSTKDKIKVEFDQFVLGLIEGIQGIKIKGIIILVVGIVLHLIFTIRLFCEIMRINDHKINILSVFLESNQKIIQFFSTKTESFLMTLHVEEVSENLQINDENDTLKKKHYSNVFGKKKRFKTTKLSKYPYIFISLIGLLSTVFYLQNYLHVSASFSFISNSFLYGAEVSKVEDILFEGTGSIKLNFLAALENREKAPELISSIKEFNARFMQYEKLLLIKHYQSFGTISQFHQFYTKVFLEDICSGQIYIEEACYNPLSIQGASLVITELLSDNEYFWSQMLQSQDNSTDSTEEIYYKSLEIIKHSYQALRQKSIQTWGFLKKDYDEKSVNILLVWMLGILCGELVLQIYLSRVVLRELKMVQNMLKFLPVSFAIESNRLQNYIKDSLNSVI